MRIRERRKCLTPISWSAGRAKLKPLPLRRIVWIAGRSAWATGFSLGSVSFGADSPAALLFPAKHCALFPKGTAFSVAQPYTITVLQLHSPVRGTSRTLQTTPYLSSPLALNLPVKQRVPKPPSKNLFCNPMLLLNASPSASLFIHLSTRKENPSKPQLYSLTSTTMNTAKKICYSRYPRIYVSAPSKNATATPPTTVAALPAPAS